MAHPFIEALFIGLFATNAADPVETQPTTPVALPDCTHCVTAPAASTRVVYDWAAGTRSVYRKDIKAPASAPLVGVTEWRKRRAADPKTG